MVVLSAAISTKGGKVLLARQFQDIPKLRVEGLLAAFSKLVGSTDKNHSYLETDSVRYLYTPLEQFYVLLITNKASNILEDLETLELIYKVTTDFCRVPEEEDILNKAYDLCFAFDEVITGGYREKVTLQQIHQYLEMDSQDERLYEMIEKSKRREAQEEAKRRQHQIEQDRRDGRMNEPYPPVAQQTYARPAVTPQATPTPSPSLHRPAPAPSQKKGMSLAPVTKKNEFLEELNSEIESTAPPPQEQQPPASSIPQAPQHQQIEQRNVHITQEEKVVVSLVHDGPVSMEVKGDVSILINDPKCARVYTSIVKPVRSAQYKTHPNIDKNRFAKENVLALKNPGRSLPTGTPLGVLKYRLVSDREEDLPLSATCWPTPNGDGTTSCIVECEVQQPHMQINFIEIHIPTLSFSPTVENVDGMFQYDGNQGILMWRIPGLGGEGEEEERKTSASLEFKIPYEGDVSAFFPIRISFTSTDSIPGFQIQNVQFVDDNGDAPFSVDQKVEVESYEIVHQ
uniref:Coatomer subunit delta n=1 Tax=Paramoeba aestuarina TaxID=180227 RepID=A0A7S4JI24_9EUKA|mmetsp:Transcript_10649/g.16033  ORF Transcript_10649/g.16033 Transcript_10649/m.16033 type:complete len:513 (+) Transcript_10649:149-1687(+)